MVTLFFNGMVLLQQSNEMERIKEFSESHYGIYRHVTSFNRIWNMRHRDVLRTRVNELLESPSLSSKVRWGISRIGHRVENTTMRLRFVWSFVAFWYSSLEKRGSHHHFAYSPHLLSQVWSSLGYWCVYTCEAGTILQLAWYVGCPGSGYRLALSNVAAHSWFPRWCVSYRLQWCSTWARYS